MGMIQMKNRVIIHENTITDSVKTDRISNLWNSFCLRDSISEFGIYT